MLLAIDAGNSTINVGLFGEEKKLLFLASLETDRRKTRDQFCVDLMNLFALYHYELQDVQGAILCSVVPALDAVLEGALTRLLGRRPVVVGPGAVTGLPMRVTLEYQVGADIIADAVGALEKFRPPIIVIDMGTATTLSYLGKNTYEGCVIAPGVRIALEALSGRAAELPHISIEAPASIMGRSTIDAMRAGVVYGNAGMIDSLIQRMEEAAGPAATVVMTGGNAGPILKHCKRDIIFDENLIIDGLYYLYQKNQDRRRKRND